VNNGSTDPSTDRKDAPLGGCDGKPALGHGIELQVRDRGT
jgi:hypothetical protein